MSLSTDESYATVAEADTYWNNRTHRTKSTTWDDASTADKEGALREATQYLDAAYRWRGVLADTDQALDWPRSGTDKEGRSLGTTVPDALTDAAAELAVEALSNPLRPSQTRGNAIQSVKAGSVEVEYVEHAPTQTTFDMVTAVLENYIYSGHTVKLRRV